MKKILLTFLLAVVATVIHAQTFTQGDFTYSTNSDGTVTCTGTSSQGASKTSLNIPGYTFNASTQKYYQVRQIAADAFKDNTTVTQVRIEPGVEVINNYAFYRCTNLAIVSLPSTITEVGQYLFYKCPITRIDCAAETIPSTLTAYTLGGLGTVGSTRYWYEGTTAGFNAANANSAITGQFTVQKNAATAYDVVGYIGSSSPNYRCTVYAIVTNPWDPTTQRGGECKIISASFASQNTTYTLEIPYNEDLTAQYARYAPLEIDDYAFQNNTTIKALRIYNVSDFKRIGTCAFQNCSNLASVTVCAKNIENFAFNNCTNLSSVQLYGYSEASYGVQTLGAYSFRNTGVTTVYIPSSLTSYGAGAFCACTSLNKFTCSSNNSYFSADATTGWLYNKNYTTLYQVGGGNYGFSNQFNTACTTIYAAAFWGNTKYVNVTLPYGIKTIGNDAFYNSAVSTLLIPGSVTSFGIYCLRNMTALKDLYINKSTIPSNLTDATTCLVNVPTGGRLHVPRGAIANYTANARWNAVFSAGKYESAYDTYLYNSGNYFYYTVTSTSTYSDTQAQSASTNGQVKVVKGYRAYWPTNVLSGDMVFPTSVTINGKTYMVTEVDRETFRDAVNVTSVSGGAGIKKIGPLSFAGMTGMTGSFNIPNVVEFGDSCLFNTLATSINLGSRLQRIGICAFRGCTKLTGTVYVPPTVTTIGSYAWWGCSALLEVVLRSTQATSLGTYLFNQNENINLYAQLCQYSNVASQTSSWLTSTGTDRHLFPCFTPTSEWSVISVPVSDNVMLPLYGEYYIAPEFDRTTMTLGLTQLNNNNGIKGYVGMLMKGTVGMIYYFRRPSTLSNYIVIDPDVNYLKGVYGASQSLSASQCVYYLDNSVNQFRKWVNTSSSMTVYSGGGYLQLPSSVIGSSTANVRFVPGDTPQKYSLYVAGTQVNEANCSDLSFINGVSGTIYYSPSSNTLYMSNATVQVPSGTSAAALQSYMSNMTIYCQGTNIIKTTSNGVYTGLQVSGNLTMTGSGTVKISSSTGDGIGFGTTCTLTIQNGLNVESTGGRYGVDGAGAGKLVLKGASTKLTANGTTASYYRTQTTLNDGLAITAPTGAYFNSSYTVVNSSGNVIKSQNVVFSKPSFTRGDVNGDGSVNINDVTTLINYLLSGNSSGINVSAADCDQSGTVNISDVTALINRLLSGNW